jgi:hypothetical protein
MMAQVLVRRDELLVRLSAWERFSAFRPYDVRIPRASVTSARATATPWTEVRGRRPTRARWPRRITQQEARDGLGCEFAAVYRNGPGIVIDCIDAEFARLVLTIDEPETLASALNAGSSRT